MITSKLRTNGLVLQDTQYSQHISGIAYDLRPINLYSNTPLKSTKKYNREFRYFWKIGKQPKYTPLWKLKEIIKKL